MSEGAARPAERVRVAELDRRYAELRLASPAEVARLRESVERQGVRQPVLVTTGVEAGKLVLVDGFKRVRVVTERGELEVQATVVALGAAAAKVALVAVNAPHQGLCDLEEAWVVRSLCREQKLTQLEVGRALGRDKSWVCRRLMLAERLEADLQAEIRLGLLSVTVARELVRLPRGNQAPLAAAIRAHGLTSRQAHVVVEALLGTEDPTARREVLADPLRYVVVEETRTATARDPRLGAGGNELRRSLLQVHGAGTRLWRSVEQHAAAGLQGEEARVLAPVVGQALRAGHQTVELCQRLLKDSGLGTTAEPPT
jgi:ParB-like chromosome segregation protein Spo0J